MGLCLQNWNLRGFRHQRMGNDQILQAQHISKWVCCALRYFRAIPGSLMHWDKFQPVFHISGVTFTWTFCLRSLSLGSCSTPLPYFLLQLFATSIASQSVKSRWLGEGTLCEREINQARMNTEVGDREWLGVHTKG